MSTLHIHQKVTFFVNQYRIFADTAGEPGELVAFAQQKRLAIKESILFYREEAKENPTFTLKAKKVLEVAGAYDVCDEHGAVLGRLKKKFSASLLRSTWHVLAPDDDQRILTIVKERSLAKAVVRRVWQLIPYLGDFPVFFRYHFNFFDPAGEVVLGTYTKTTLFRDHYRLDVSDKLAAQCDWRVFAAMGVALDALQSR